MREAAPMADAKDWTWVLVRTCPDCRFPAATLPRGEIASTVRRVTEQFVVVLGREDVGERPAPDVWSPLEYGCHVVDVFEVIGRRLRLLLDEDAPVFPDWDQDVTALDRGYAGQDPDVVVGRLRTAGADLAQAFDDVRDDQWDRPGTRSDGATFTVETLGRYLAHDLEHHRWDVDHTERR